MSKATTTIIIPAEEIGWEVWQNQQGELVKQRTVGSALAKEDVSSGERLALPVEAVATLPIKVATSDEELYRGAAQLELEKAGLVGESEDDSWDCDLVADKGPGSVVAGYALMEDMLASAEVIQDVQLDYSPRCYPVGIEDLVLCWREHGKWILVCYSGGKPFYTEVLGRDIASTLAPAVKQLGVQLMLSGVQFEPHKIVIWTSDTTALDDGLLVQLAAETGMSVEPEVKPIPFIPGDSLKLRTASMNAWSKKQAAGSRARVWFLGVALMYLVAAGFVMLKWKKLDEQIEDQKRLIAANEEAYQGSTEHINKWNELKNLRRQDWPLQVYKRSTELLPPGNSVRFDMVQIQDPEVVITGSSSAPTIEPLNKYAQQLKSDAIFNEMSWDMKPHRKNPKTGRWDFDFTANKKEVY